MNSDFFNNMLSYKETPKMKWFKDIPYKIKGKFIIPDHNENPSEYFPFNLYEKKGSEKKYSQSPHQIFANIDISDTSQIESFYDKYGPLGFYNRDIVKLVTFSSMYSSFKFPGKLPIGAVLRNSIVLNENYNRQTSNLIELGIKYQHQTLVPFDDIVLKYNIPKHVYEYLDPDEIEFQLSSLDIMPYYTSESLEDFKRECTKFKFLMELINSLEKSQPDIEKLKILLKSKRYDVEGSDFKFLARTASGIIRSYINAELNMSISPILDWDETEFMLSRNVSWKCNSLLTAMYLMLFLDITKSNFNTKCAHCGAWFYSERAHATYCNNPTCKWSENKEKQKYKKEEEKKDEVLKLLNLNNSIKDVSKITNVRKKTINRWIIEMEMEE